MAVKRVVQLGTYVKPAVKESLRERAKRANRTLSQEAAYILERVVLSEQFDEQPVAKSA